MIIFVLFIYVGVLTRIAGASEAPYCPLSNTNLGTYLPANNCAKYWICRNGRANLFECPDGLHFNRNSNSCDDPDTALCSKIVDSSEESQSSDEESRELIYEIYEQEICSSVANRCRAVDDDQQVYIPLPNCSQYCQCSNGLPYLHNCPQGLHFNPFLNVCDWPQDAGCLNANSTNPPLTTESNGGNGTQPSITTENSVVNQTAATTESTLSPPSNGGTGALCPESLIAECPAIDGEIPVYIPLPNCSQFCQCSNGLPYLHNCPDGLHFSPVLNVCVWQEDAGCNVGNGTVVPSTTESSGITELDPTISTESGSNETNSSTITGTSQTEPSVTTEGLSSTESNSVTTTGSNETDSSVTTESTASSDTDSSITTDSSDTSTGNGGTGELCPETITDECPAVDDEYPVYIPLPNCSQFCQCFNGLPYLHNCPGGLHFNPVLKVCDWPQDAGCDSGEGTAIPSTSEDSSSTELEPTSSTDSENGGTGSTITTESNEIGETEPSITTDDPIITTESAGDETDSASSTDIGETAPSVTTEDISSTDTSNSVTTTEISETDPSVTTENNASEADSTVTTESSDSTTGNGGTGELCPDTVIDECPAVDDEYPVYIPLPNCTQFCQCSNGLPYLHNCPDGLHFNPVLYVCDWSQDAGCKGGEGTDIPSTTEDSSSTELEPTSSTDSENGGTDSAITTESNEIGETEPSITTDDPIITTESAGNETDSASSTEISETAPSVTTEYISSTENNSVTTESSDPDPSITTESNNSTNTDSPVTTESIETTTENGEIGVLCPDTVADECPAVDDEHPVYIPLPNCGQFCQCSNGLPYLHNCPEGLHFNPVLKVCDWPEDAGCKGSPTTEISV